MSPVVIRPATSEELHDCVQLQVDVWGFAERDVVPFNQLHAAHEWGGRVLVAVDGDRVIGFCYGFGGQQYGKPALLSHMAAVLPEYRGQGLAADLKLAQARWALSRGYDLVTWTYDPLELVNANLNIGRLGGIVRQYLVNHYGDMTDSLNKGLPSDRMLVEWHLTSDRVTRILNGETPPPVVAERSCRIPANVRFLKENDPPAAFRWRMAVREQLLSALSEGFQVSGFQTDAEGGVYLLTREEEHRAS